MIEKRCLSRKEERNRGGALVRGENFNFDNFASSTDPGVLITGAVREDETSPDSLITSRLG